MKKNNPITVALLTVIISMTQNVYSMNYITTLIGGSKRVLQATTNQLPTMLRQHRVAFSVLTGLSALAIIALTYRNNPALKTFLYRKINPAHYAATLRREYPLPWDALLSSNDDKWGGNKYRSELLLNGGININEQGLQGQTALHVAATKGQINCVQYLVEHGAVLQTVDDDGYTPLQRATQQGHTAVASYLSSASNATHHENQEDAALNNYRFYWTAFLGDDEQKNIQIIDAIRMRGIDINTKNNSGDRSALHHAISRGHMALSDHLIALGARIELTGNYDGPPLFVAAGQGNLAIIQHLIEQFPASICSQNNIGQTLVHSAVRGGQLAVLKYLVEDLGMPVNCVDNEGSTPLHLSNQHEEIARYLVAHGADIDARCNYHRTPLIIAANYFGDDIGTLRFLVQECNANVNARDKFGSTPLHKAKNNFDAVRILVEHGADVNAIDAGGQTPLFWITNIASAQCLITHGAELNVHDSKGHTPLCLAVHEGLIDMVRLFIRHNAQINAQAENGDTPSSIALNEGHCTIANLLLKNMPTNS